MNIEEIKDRICGAFTSWAERKIELLVEGNPHLAVVSPYLKRGARNWLAKERERISAGIDNAAMFIADGNGEVNAKTLTDDILTMFRDMPETEFGEGMIKGTVGKGRIRLELPDGIIGTLLFGGGCAISVTADDLAELRDCILV
mgnify:CR=1 FL=1